ncbi:hypothetical protein NPIL_497831 [Nephila pilipes]|uniref:Uncharacterized protein n=1 Tax=Nephila pilipes TaxID=299642 RepID=A0A8X6PSU8_NEPPI|nr:hypothetical protein NPIL_497831 [Nephila pilipes]
MITFLVILKLWFLFRQPKKVVGKEGEERSGLLQVHVCGGGLARRCFLEVTSRVGGLQSTIPVRIRLKKIVRFVLEKDGVPPVELISFRYLSNSLFTLELRTDFVLGD